MQIEVRPAASRFETRTDWVVSRHSFSYGPHYDPANTRFGPLVSHNDDVLSPGAGFPDHPHRELEIVTWVIAGALEHSDSGGGRTGHGILRPGMVGHLSAGSGVHHTETNAADVAAGDTRYVQMWVLPDADGLPSYEVVDVSAALASADFVLVASGSEPAPIRLRRHGATFMVARLRVGRSAALPVAPLVHVYVAKGAVLLAMAASPAAQPISLAEGDAARLSDVASAQVDATSDAEVLVWAMEATR